MVVPHGAGGVERGPGVGVTTVEVGPEPGQDPHHRQITIQSGLVKCRKTCRHRHMVSFSAATIYVIRVQHSPYLFHTGAKSLPLKKHERLFYRHDVDV